MNKLEKVILLLDKFTERRANPRYKILKNQGYKFIVAENHIIFYK
ncbi:hypothetical protein [Haploplasma axanthum]|nr:hypothetical protein [Haploplasma axanthum]